MTAIRVISPNSLIREHFVNEGLLVRVEECRHDQVGDAAVVERSHHALVRALVVDGHPAYRVSDPHPDRRILDQNTQKGHWNEYWQHGSKGKRHDHQNVYLCILVVNVELGPLVQLLVPMNSLLPSLLR